MIRKLLLLAALAAAVWWLISRREGAGEPGVVVGFDDGSSVVLEEGSPARERLLAIAREVARA